MDGWTVAMHMSRPPAMTPQQSKELNQGLLRHVPVRYKNASSVDIRMIEGGKGMMVRRHVASENACSQ
jgi:hypothetical protein